MGSLTVRPQESQNADKQKASLRNLHGDTLSTLNKEGVDETGILLYEPFGTEISATSSFEAANSGVSFAQAATAVDNADGNLEGRWAVSYDMNVEALFSVKPVQMGERVYIPGLGRFIQVDPQEGGTPNDYVYVLDPVNSSDYTGKGFFIPLVILAIRVAPIVIRVVSAAVTAVKAAKVVSKVTKAANTVSKAVSNVARSVYNGVKSKFSSSAGKTSKGSTPSKPQVTPPKKGYTPRNPATLNRNYSTYVLRDSSKNVKYVGITSRGTSVRGAEHAADPSKFGLQIKLVGSNMTKYQARVWEQQQINQLGMQKNGGQLINKINSISPNRWAEFGL